MTTELIDPEHLPLRPGWLCAVCSADWPCAAAKAVLTEQYVHNYTALRIYLAQQYWEAIDDSARLGGIKIITRLRDRFLGWTDALGSSGEVRP